MKLRFRRRLIAGLMTATLFGQTALPLIEVLALWLTAPRPVSAGEKCDGWAEDGSKHRNSGNGCTYQCSNGSWGSPTSCDGQGNGQFQGEAAKTEDDRRQQEEAVKDRERQAQEQEAKQSKEETRREAERTAAQRAAEAARQQAMVEAQRQAEIEEVRRKAADEEERRLREEEANRRAQAASAQVAQAAGTARGAEFVGAGDPGIVNVAKEGYTADSPLAGAEPAEAEAAPDSGRATGADTGAGCGSSPAGACSPNQDGYWYRCQNGSWQKDDSCRDPNVLTCTAPQCPGAFGCVDPGAYGKNGQDVCEAGRWRKAGTEPPDQPQKPDVSSEALDAGVQAAVLTGSPAKLAKLLPPAELAAIPAGAPLPSPVPTPLPVRVYTEEESRQRAQELLADETNAAINKIRQRYFRPDLSIQSCAREFQQLGEADIRAGCDSAHDAVRRQLEQQAVTEMTSRGYSAADAQQVVSDLQTDYQTAAAKAAEKAAAAELERRQQAAAVSILTSGSPADLRRECGRLGGDKIDCLDAAAVRQELMNSLSPENRDKVSGFDREEAEVNQALAAILDDQKLVADCLAVRPGSESICSDRVDTLRRQKTDELTGSLEYFDPAAVRRHIDTQVGLQNSYREYVNASDQKITADCLAARPGSESICTDRDEALRAAVLDQLPDELKPQAKQARAAVVEAERFLEQQQQAAEAARPVETKEEAMTIVRQCQGKILTTTTSMPDPAGAKVEFTEATTCEWGCSAGACRGATPEEAQTYRYNILENALERAKLRCDQIGDDSDRQRCLDNSYQTAVNNLQLDEKTSPVQARLVNQPPITDSQREALVEAKYQQLVSEVQFRGGGRAGTRPQIDQAELQKQAEAQVDKALALGSLDPAGGNVLIADSPAWDVIGSASVEEAQRTIDQQGILGQLVANTIFCNLNEDYRRSNPLICVGSGIFSEDTLKNYYSFMIAGKSEQKLWDQGMTFGDPESPGFQIREYEDVIAPACGVRPEQRSLTAEETACLTGQIVAKKFDWATVEERNRQTAAVNLAAAAAGFAGGIAGQGIKAAGGAVAKGLGMVVGTGAVTDALLAPVFAEVMTAGARESAAALTALSQSGDATDIQRQVWQEQAETAADTAEAEYKSNLVMGIVMAGVVNLGGEALGATVGRGLRETLGDTAVGRLLFGSPRTAATAAREIANVTPFRDRNGNLWTPAGEAAPAREVLSAELWTKEAAVFEVHADGGLGRVSTNVDRILAGVDNGSLREGSLIGVVGRDGNPRLFRYDGDGNLVEWLPAGAGAAAPAGAAAGTVPELTGSRVVTPDDVAAAADSVRAVVDGETPAVLGSREPQVVLGGPATAGLLPGGSEVAAAVDAIPVPDNSLLGRAARTVDDVGARLPEVPAAVGDAVGGAVGGVKRAIGETADDIRIGIGCGIGMSPVPQVYAASGGCITIPSGKTDVPELGEGVSVRPDAAAQAVEIHAPGAAPVVIREGHTATLPNGETVHVIAVNSDGIGTIERKSPSPTAQADQITNKINQAFQDIDSALATGNTDSAKAQLSSLIRETGTMPTESLPPSLVDQTNSRLAAVFDPNTPSNQSLPAKIGVEIELSIPKGSNRKAAAEKIQAALGAESISSYSEDFLTGKEGFEIIDPQGRAWRVLSDASVYRSAEIISPPLETNQDFLLLSKIIGDLHQVGFRSYSDGGTHIHIDGKYLLENPNKLLGIIDNLVENSDRIYHSFGVGQERAGRYAVKPGQDQNLLALRNKLHELEAANQLTAENIQETITQIYGITSNPVINNLKVVGNEIWYGRSIGHSEGINVSNLVRGDQSKTTVELRFFNSTDNQVDLFENLLFAREIVQNPEAASLTRLPTQTRPSRPKPPPNLNTFVVNYFNALRWAGRAVDAGRNITNLGRETVRNLPDFLPGRVADLQATVGRQVGDAVGGATATVRNALDDGADAGRILKNCGIGMSPVPQVYAASGGCITVPAGKTDVPELGEGVSVKPDVAAQAVEIHTPGADPVVIHQGETAVLPTGEEVHVVAVKSDGTAVIRQTDAELPVSTVPVGELAATVKENLKDNPDLLSTVGPFVKTAREMLDNKPDVIVLPGDSAVRYEDAIHSIAQAFETGDVPPIVAFPTNEQWITMEMEIDGQTVEVGVVLPGPNLLAYKNLSDFRGATGEKAGVRGLFNLADRVLENRLKSTPHGERLLEIQAFLKSSKEEYHRTDSWKPSTSFRRALLELFYPEQMGVINKARSVAFFDDVSLTGKKLCCYDDLFEKDFVPSIERYVVLAEKQASIPAGTHVGSTESVIEYPFLREFIEGEGIAQQLVKSHNNAFDYESLFTGSPAEKSQLREAFFSTAAEFTKEQPIPPSPKHTQEYTQFLREKAEPPMGAARIRNAAEDAAAGMSKGVNALTESVTEAVGGAAAGIRNAAENMGKAVGEAANSIKSVTQNEAPKLSTDLTTNLDNMNNTTQSLAETHKGEFSQVLSKLEEAKAAQSTEEQVKLFGEAHKLMLEHLLDNQPAYATANILTETEIYALFGANRDELLKSLEDGLSAVRQAKKDIPVDDSLYSPFTRLTRLETNIGDLMVRLNPKISDILEDRTPEAVDFKKFIYYTTGTWLEPGSEYKLAQRMIEDGKIIRQKYGLPPQDLKFNNTLEYIDRLKAKAKEEGIPIRIAIEFQDFFESHPNAGAVYMEDTNTIVVPNKDFNDPDQIFKYASNLEHELTHALQNKYYPSMPIEGLEYEAYMVNLSQKRAIENPIDAIEITFSFFVRGSVDSWYKDVGIRSVPWASIEPPTFFDRIKSTMGVGEPAGIVAPGFRGGEPFGPGGWFDVELRGLRDENGNWQFPVGRKSTESPEGAGNPVRPRGEAEGEVKISAAGGEILAGPGFAGAVDHRGQGHQDQSQGKDRHNQIEGSKFVHDVLPANQSPINQNIMVPVTPYIKPVVQLLSNKAGIKIEPIEISPAPTAMSTKALNWPGLNIGFRGTNTSSSSAIEENGNTIDNWLSMLAPQVYAAEKNSARIVPLSVYKMLAGQIMVKKVMESLPEEDRTGQRLAEAVLAAGTIVNTIPKTGALSSNEAGYTAVSGTAGTAAGAVAKGIYRVTAEAVGGLDLTVPEKVNVGVNGDGAVLIGVAEGKGRVKVVGGLEWWEKPMLRLGEWIESWTIDDRRWTMDEQESAVLGEEDERPAAAMPLTVQLYIDENKNGKMDGGEESAKLAGVKVNLVAETKTVSYKLTEGWNFIAFPVVPESVKTAAELVQDVALDGGYVTTVAAWEGDKWAEFSQRGAEKFGQDFELQPGRAYFLNSHSESTWTLAGTPLPEEKRVLQLRKGWNGVGIPKQGTTAVQVMDEIQGTIDDGRWMGGEAADQVGRWDFGLWDVVVKRRYSPEHHEIYGRDFPIRPEEGYFIHANEDVRFQ